ncbi:unnamed protein product [Caenorhabditis auriculariae]|uniref:Hexosyltransferase n=1 Tax=Caenorhabditis auriculariae TaxID=2777116 RepID=A0A8S1HHM0_9PELO|nr:unnamed protein product [Caenorhabditis auriculariae]
MFKQNGVMYCLFYPNICGRAQLARAQGAPAEGKIQSSTSPTKMVTGGRTGAPLLGGVLLGSLLSMALFSGPSELVSSSLAAWSGSTQCSPSSAARLTDQTGALEQNKVYKDVSEHWVVHQDEMPPAPPNQDATPKVVRSRFAATELGTRERLMVAVMAESALALSINTTLGRHVPRVHLFADAGRIDNDLAQLTNLSPYKLNGQKSHSMVLGLMFNMTVHENYDWFLIVKDSTYINPFVLLRLIDTINWSEPVLMGEAADDGSGRCRLDTGVLLSNPAMQTLIQQRHTCNMLATASDGDQLAFEKCLQLATNLTCKTEHQGVRYDVWRGAERADSPAAHDSIEEWRNAPAFNRSLAVPRILSDADAVALHDHFVGVEMERTEREIEQMEMEVAKLTEEAAHEKGEPISWPEALPAYSKPPNRYQVPSYEFFNMKEIFRSEPMQNVHPLEGNDLEDVLEAVEAARRQVEAEEHDLEFLQMRNGYRLFDPRRGMDYMIDLTYRRNGAGALPQPPSNDAQQPEDEIVQRRVHVNRMIASTQLMSQVPYVKEDTDVTIVVPVGSEIDVMPARKHLARHARLCLSPNEETRKTRMVVAIFPGVDPRSATYITNDLEELKRRCKNSALDTDVLTVHPSVTSQGKGTVAAAALDDAVDRYGANTIYALMSPHADVQKEFFDRLRINTIKHYQVFFPVPFVEYHPIISGMDITEEEAKQSEISSKQSTLREAALSRLRNGVEPKRTRPLIVQKDYGRFDTLDYSCFAVYGVDYVAARARLGPNDKRNDLIAAFLGQDQIHVLRTIEPNLRVRYHKRVCELQSVDPDDVERCLASKNENVAAKDQLAKLLFHEK